MDRNYFRLEANIFKLKPGLVFKMIIMLKGASVIIINIPALKPSTI
jgi:hypothetical protein